MKIKNEKARPERIEFKTKIIMSNRAEEEEWQTVEVRANPNGTT
jgi:hypothetical protein